MAAFSTGAPIVKIYHDKSMILPDVSRVLACLYEKDIKFERHTASSYKSLLKLQALNHAPVPFYDGPTTFLEESREICRYIAETYEHHGYPFLLGKDSLERASIEQWLHHEEHAFNPPSRSLFCHLAFRLDDEDDDVDLQKRKLDEVLEIYEQRLSDTEFLAGNKFTLADLVHLPNSHYITASDKFVYLYDSRKNVQRWWNAISTRDSWKKVLKDIKEVEQQREQYESEKQQQQQWQREHPTPTRRQTRLHHRKHTRTKSQTILVPPPVGIISTSPMALQAEKPLPPEIPLDETPTSSPSTPSSHKSSAVQSKQATIFPTHIDTPQASVRSTLRIPEKSPVSSQRKINFFTPFTSPATADKPPKIDADNSSIRDVSIPSEATEADLPTKSKPSSSKEVPTNLHVFDFYKASSPIDEAGPDIEPTPQETAETLDKFSETDGPSNATVQAKISPSSANEDPDQLRASMNDDSHDKESVRYTDRTPQRPAEIIYGRYNTQRGTDTSPGKLLSTEAHQELKAEQWHAATADLTKLKGETDHIRPTQQVKHRKDVQWYSSQDSKQPSTHPRAQEPASMDGQLAQGPEMTTQTPHTDQRRDVSSVLWQRAADTRGISEEDEASSDHRGAGLPPYTRRIAEAPKIVPADQRKDAPLQKRARDDDAQATPFQTAYDDPHDATQEARETTSAPRQKRAEAHDTSVGTGTYHSVPPRSQPTNASYDAVPPSKQVVSKGPRHATTPYPGAQDLTKEARESPASRPTVPHDAQGSTDAEETVKSSSSEAQLLDSRLVDAFPPKQFLDEDGHRAVPQYTDDQHNKKQDRDPSASRKIAAETLDYRQADALPRRQPPAKDPQNSTSPFQKRYFGDEDTAKKPRPRNMVAQEVQDNSEETKAGDSWSSREQPSDNWQAPGPLPTYHSVPPRSQPTNASYDAVPPSKQVVSKGPRHATTPYPGAQDLTKEARESPASRPTVPHDAQGSTDAEETVKSSSSEAHLLDSRLVDAFPPKQFLDEDGHGAVPQYTDDQHNKKQDRDPSASRKIAAETLDYRQADALPRRQPPAKDPQNSTSPFQKRYFGDEDTAKKPRPRNMAAHEVQDNSEEIKAGDSWSSREQPSDTWQAPGPLPSHQVDEARSTRTPFRETYPHTRGTTKEAEDITSMPWGKAGEDTKDTFEEIKFPESASSRDQPLDYQRTNDPSRKQEAIEHPLGATSPLGKRYADVEGTSKHSRDTSFKPRKMEGGDVQDASEEADARNSHLAQHLDAWRVATTPSNQAGAEDVLSMSRSPPTRHARAEETSKQPRAVASTPTYIAAQDARDALRESNIADSSSSIEQPSDARALVPLPNKKVHDTQRYPDTEGDIKEGKDTFEEAKNLDSASSQVQPLKSQGADAQSRKKEAAEDPLRATSPFRKRHSDVEETTKQYRENNFKRGKIVDHDAQGIQVETEAGGFVLPRDQPSDTWQAAAIPTQNEATQDGSRLTPPSEKRSPTNEETIEQPRGAVSTPRRITAEDENNKFQTSKHADSVLSRKQPLSAWQPSVTRPRQEIDDSHDTTAASPKTNPYESRTKQASDTTFAPRKIGAGDTKYISKGTKVADSASPGAKPTYTPRAALPLSDQEKNEEHARDKGGESREAISAPKKMVSRDSQYTPVGINTIGSTSREQSLDHEQASSLSRETAAEDATDATRGARESFLGERKNSQDFKGTTKKSESTLQGPGSRLPTTQSLGSQDPQRTNGSFRTPSGEQWKDVSTQLQSDVEDIYKQPNSLSGHQKGLGSPLSQAEAGNEDQAITGEKIFSDSQVTSSKTQPTDSQDPIKVNRTPSVYQEDPLVARDHHEKAQTLSTGERADGSIPKHRQAPVVPSTSEEKSTASAPPKAKVHDDHSAEEPSKRGTVVHRKEATPLLVQEPPLHVQGGTEMLQEAVDDGDASSKLSTIDQWWHASMPLQDVTPNSGDNELGVSSIDQKPTPMSQKEILSAQDANEMIKSSPDKIVEQPAPTRAQTSDGQHAPPSVPGAARDERPGESVQMQAPTLTTRPRAAPDTREAGNQEFIKTSDGLISKASKATDDSAIVYEDVRDTSLSANDDISDSKTATSNDNEAQGSGTWPDSIPAPVNARLSTDDEFRRFLRDKGAQPPESAQAQTPLEARSDSASTRNVPSDVLQVTKFGKLTSTEGIVPAAEPASTLEAQLDVPLRAEADHPEYKLAPSDKRTARAAEPLPSVELESLKDGSISAADQTKTPQTIFRQQTRPPAPITRELPSADTQHDMKKIQEVTLDNLITDDSAKPYVSPTSGDKPSILPGKGAESPTATRATNSEDLRNSASIQDRPANASGNFKKPGRHSTAQETISSTADQASDLDAQPDYATGEVSPAPKKLAPSDQDSVNSVEQPSSVETRKEKTIVAATEQTLPTAIDQQDRRGRREGPTLDIQHSLPEQKFAPSDQDVTHTSQLPSSTEKMNEEIEDSVRSSQPLNSVVPDQIKKSTTIGQQDISQAPAISKSPSSGTHHAPGQATDLDTQRDSARGEVLPAAKKFAPSVQDSVNSAQRPSLAETRKEETVISAAEQILPRVIGQQDTQGMREAPTSDTQHPLSEQKFAKPVDSLLFINKLEQDSAHSRQQPSSAEPTNEEIKDPARSAQPLFSALPDQTKKSTTVGQQDISPAPGTSESPSSEPLSVVESRKEEPQPIISQQDTRNAPGISEPMLYVDRNKKFVPRNGQVYHFQRDSEPHEVSPPDVQDVKRITTLSQAEISDPQRYSLPASVDVDLSSGHQSTPDTREAGDQEFNSSDGQISKASKATHDSAVIHEDVRDTSLSTNDDIADSKTATSNVNEAQGSGTWPDSTSAPSNVRLATDDDFRRFLHDKGAQPPESAQAQTPLEARSDSVSTPNVPSDVLNITKFGKPTSTEDIASAAAPASTLETQLAAPLRAEADHPENKLTPSDKRTARAAEPLPSVELESLKEDASVSAAEQTKTPQTIFRQQTRPPAPIRREVPSADARHDMKKIQEVTLDNFITDDSAKPTSDDKPGILPGKGAESPTAIQATNSEDLRNSASIRDRPANDFGNVKKLTPYSTEQEAISFMPDQVSDLDAEPDYATGDVSPAAKKFAPSDQDLVNSVKQPSSVEVRKEKTIAAAAEETLPTTIGQLDTRGRREAPASDIQHSLPEQKFAPSDQDLAQTTQLPSSTERMNEEIKDSARSSQPLNSAVTDQIKKPTTIGQQDISHAPGISESPSSGAHHAPGKFQDVASDAHHIDNSIPSQGKVSRLKPGFEPSEGQNRHVHSAIDEKTMRPSPSQAQSSDSKPDSTQNNNDERSIRFLPNQIAQQREETRAPTLPMGLNDSHLAQGVPADALGKVKSLEPPLIDQEATAPRVASDLTPATDLNIVPEEVDPTRQKLFLKDQDIALPPALDNTRGPSSDSQPASQKIQEINPDVHRIDGPIPSQEQVREGPTPDTHGAIVQEPNTHTTGPKSAPQTQLDMAQGEISSDEKKFEVSDKDSDRGSQTPASAESTEEETDAIASDQNMTQQTTFGHEAIMPAPGRNEASGEVLEVSPGDHQSSELTKPPISQKQDSHAGHSAPYEGPTPDLSDVVGEKTPSPLVSQIHSVEAGSNSSANDDVHPTSRDEPVTELRREQEMQPAPVFQASVPSKASADAFGKVEPLKATGEVTPADQSIAPSETFSPVESRKEESTVTKAKQSKSSQPIIGQQDARHVPEISEPLLDDDRSKESISWKEQVSHDQCASEPHEASTLDAQHGAPIPTDQTKKSTTVGQQDISPATGISEFPSSEPLSIVESRKEESQPIIGQQDTQNAPGISEPMLDDDHNKKSVSRDGQVYQYQRASEPDEISPPDVQDAKRITTPSQEKISNPQGDSLQASVDVDPSNGHQSTTRSSPDQWAQLPERTKSPPLLEASIYSESTQDVPKSSTLPSAAREVLSPTVVPAPSPDIRLGTASGQDLTRFVQPPFPDEPTKEETTVAASEQTTDGRTIIGEQASMPGTDKGKTPFSESYTQHALTKIQERTPHDDLTDESAPGQEQASLAENVSEPRGGTTTDSHGINVDESITTSPYSQEKLSEAGSDSGPTRPAIHPSSDDETTIRTIPEQGVQQPAIAQDVSFDSSVKGKSTTQEVTTPSRRLALALDTQPASPQGEVVSSEHKHAITDVSSQPPFSVEPQKQERNIAAADQQNAPQTIFDRQIVTPAPDAKKSSREVERSDRDDLHASDLAKPLNVIQEQVPRAGSASQKQEGPTLDVGGAGVDEKVAFPSSQAQNSDIRPASTPINGDAQPASGDGPATSSLTVSQAQQSAGTQAPAEAIGIPQIIQSVPADSLGKKEFAGPLSTDEEVMAPTTSPAPAQDAPQGTARGEANPAEPKFTLLDQHSAHSTRLSPPVESRKQVSSVAKSDPTYVSQSSDGPNVARPAAETESAGSLLPMAGTESVQPPHEAPFNLSSDKKITMTQGDQSKTLSDVSFSGSQTVGQLESGADKGELSEELISSYSRKSLEGTSTEEKAEQKQQTGLSNTRSSEDDNKDTNVTISPTVTFGGIQALPPMENTESTEESRKPNKADQTVGQSSQDSEKQREETEARDNGSDEAEKTDLDEYNQKNNGTYQGVQQLSKNKKSVSKSTNKAASGIQTDYKSESGLRTSEESKQQVQTEGKTEDGKTKAAASKTEQPEERDLPASSRSVASQSQAEASDEPEEQTSSRIQKTGKNPGKLDSSTNDTKSSDKKDNLSS